MKASFTTICALCNVCTRKRPNQEFLPNPNRTEPNLRFFCRTEPAKTSRTPNRNFGRFLTHTRKRPNQEFLSNSNRTEPNRTSDFFCRTESQFWSLPSMHVIKVHIHHTLYMQTRSRNSDRNCLVKRLLMCTQQSTSLITHQYVL